MRFREKDERGLRPSETERPKGKTQIIIILFVEIALTPGRRSEAECNFHSVGAFSGISFRLVEKKQKPKFPHIFGRTNVQACTPLKGSATALEPFWGGAAPPAQGAPCISLID